MEFRVRIISKDSNVQDSKDHTKCNISSRQKKKPDRPEKVCPGHNELHSDVITFVARNCEKLGFECLVLQS